MATLTRTFDAPVVAPTQELRDLIEDSSNGTVGLEELHNALLKLEIALGLPMTQPAEMDEEEL